MRGKKDVLDTVAFHAAQKGLFIAKICIQMQGEKWLKTADFRGSFWPVFRF